MQNTDGNLIIFIDSYPYNILQRTGYFENFTIRRKMNPGFGYSINLQAEIFTGKCPDDLGYFCEWRYSPQDSRFARWKAPFNLLRPSRRFYYLDRIAHRALGKFFGNIGTIPFSYLPYLCKVPGDVFQNNFGHASLFTAFPSIKLISFRDFKHLPSSQKDIGVYQGVLQAIPHYNNIVATLVDLDGLAHGHGIDSEIYLEHLQKLDSWINTLSEKFLKLYPKGSVIIVSDHGIAPVSHGLDPAIEKNFGRPALKRYYYFVDATILRIWTFDPILRQEMHNYLDTCSEGSPLTDSERRDYGLAHAGHGDLIFQLKEEVMFQPSFWGKGLSHAMHGYHPSCERQQGIFLIRSEKKEAVPGLPVRAIRTTESFSILHEMVYRTCT